MANDTHGTETKITGRTANRASGTDNNGKRRTWHVGDRTTIQTTVACGDGGDLSGCYDIEIVRLGLGTQYGMRGDQIGLAECRYTGRRPVDDYGLTRRRERPEHFTVAIRYLTDPVKR